MRSIDVRPPHDPGYALVRPQRISSKAFALMLYAEGFVMSQNGVDSAAWYDRNTKDYVERTEFVDMSDVHARFLAHVPAGGRILDAGCGSGRDSLAFQRLGYDVVPMDASIEMVRHASARLGKPGLHLRHEDIDFVEAFEAVWSNASLLHVTHAELPAVLRKYRDALVPGGVLFASFKHGEGQRISTERLFASQTAASFRDVIGQVPGMELIETWIETDRRPGREHEEWLNTLSRKAG
jgi:SAM-dependent methyltransferase